MGVLDEVIGDSPAIVAMRETIRRVLRRHGDVRRLPPVLLLGETGTGKGLVARAIHRASPRAPGPFIDVNCAAIPETMLEAEMFGFERGAFTDARQAKAGLFQAAHGGTIFLDELGLLSESLQGKLLKVIEERTVRRLGSTRSEPVDVWIVAGTNEDLAAAARAHRFREDLYHRLAVLTIELPPLRARGDDVVRLAEHFLARACADYDLPPKTLTLEARRALAGYPWPGNVRELGNVMERVALLTDSPEVTAPMLGLPDRAGVIGPRAARGQRPEVFEVSGGAEREQLLQVLRATDWNVSQAAARLGITRNALRYRLEKHRLARGMADPVIHEPVLRSARPAVARLEPAVSAVTAAPASSVADESPALTAIRWERRRLTLLRVELAVVAAVQETLEASRYLGTAIDKVQSFGGSVEEVSRTGLVAVFGLDPVEDAPRRAALAAMAIQKATDRVADGRLTFRLAIHVGQLMVGRVRGSITIDADAKRDVWAILGDLGSDAEPGAIVVSEGAAAFLDRRFDMAKMGGPASAGPAYRLVGRERAGLGVSGRMAPFVGRHDELSLLRARFESAVQGQGQVVGIVGDAGIGKSRLLFEFRQSLEQPVTYIEAHCMSYGAAVPYLPVLEMVKTLCAVSEADGQDVLRQKVGAGVAQAGLDAGVDAAPLLALLGVEERSDRLVAVDLEATKAKTFRALKQMILSRSRRTPCVIVVEDVHWIDGMSQDYLVSLGDVLPGARIVLVCTYRPGYLPPWIGRSFVTQMALQPLAPDASGGIVRSILTMTDVGEAVVDLILAKAEGNPFFLEELARSVREHGDASMSVTVPDTVEQVILARIDRLSARDRQVLQAAAVIGRQFPVSLLQAVATVDQGELLQALQRLRSAEFVHEAPFDMARAYAFSHTLTQEVAYASVRPEARRELHAACVDAIERLGPDRVAELVNRIADHAVRGEVWDRAVKYLQQAGLRAASRSAHHEAVALLEGAAAALARLPETRALIEQSIDLRIDLRNSLLPLGDDRRILEHLLEAERLAEALGDRRRLGWVSTYMTHYFWWMGDPDRAIESGQRALAIAAAVDDFVLGVLTTFHLGQAYHSLGDYRPAIECLERTVSSLRGELLTERFGILYAVRARSWLAWSLAELGDFARGIARAEEGVRLAETVDQPFSLITTYLGLGMLYLRKGDLEKSVEVLERGLELCRARDLPVLFPTIASRLGAAYALSGRVDDAVPLLERGARQAASMRRLSGHSLRLAHLGEAYLLAGRLEEAVDAATRAFDLARQHKERGFQAWALRLLGEVAARAEPPDADNAQARYAQALTLARELGMRPLQALCHLGRGQLFRRLRQDELARAELSIAVELFQSMEMRFWLTRAEALRAAEPTS